MKYVYQKILTYSQPLVKNSAYNNFLITLIDVIKTIYAWNTAIHIEIKKCILYDRIISVSNSVCLSLSFDVLNYFDQFILPRSINNTSNFLRL